MPSILFDDALRSVLSDFSPKPTLLPTENMLTLSTITRARRTKRLVLPLFQSGVRAGFPSPATDYIDKTLDLNELLIRNPSATFYVKVEGEAMAGLQIFPGDTLIVDRSLTPADGNIIIAAYHGELVVCRLHRKGGRMVIETGIAGREMQEITEQEEFEVWGVVAYAVHLFL
jgi:DNA polymerase V